MRFLLALCLLSASAFASRSHHLPKFLLGRPTSRGFVDYGHRHENYDNVQFDAPKLINNTVNQKIDHFDAKNNAMYKQRYWYNPSFTQNKSIVFLMIQGESPATDIWISNPGYQYLQWAKEFGADVFQLEHRCFGQSRPFPDMSTAHLKTCTIAQALEDINGFITQMNTMYNFTNPKWITFGGSYPGTLSALFRAHYPTATVGAIASSAPVKWTLDYFQYAQGVESTLQQTDPKCRDSVNTAFKQMQTLSLTWEGIQQLNNIFQLNPPFKKDQYIQRDIDNFFANVYGFYQDVIQYTYDGRNNATKNGLNAKNLCNIMTDGNGKEVQNVKTFIDWVNKMNNDTVGPFDNSYDLMIKNLANITFDDESSEPGNLAANRGWMWLCCNELGALQTTDSGRNIFQQTVPLNYYIDMCTDMFGEEVNIKYIRDKNLRTTQTYGDNNSYRASNIVLPNGSFDPWHALGFYKNSTADHMTSILIPGAAHCSDMYPVYDGEPKGLVAARKVIHDELKYFLGL